MALLLIFLLLLPIFIIFLLKKHETNKTSCFPPGPRGLPFIGNLHQFDTSNPQKCLWQLSQKYGPLMFLKLGCKPTLVVSSAKMAREVLQTHDLEFCGRPSTTGSLKLSYNGLDLAFSPYGDYWKEMRKICVVHLFSSNRVQDFRPIREDEVSYMIEKISKSATASKPFNLTEAMMSLTSTIICRVAFGKRYDDGDGEKTRFQRLLNEGQAMLAGFFVSDHLPCMDWVDKLTGLQSRLEKNFHEFDVFYQEIIDEYLDPNRPKPEHENILLALLRLYKDPSFKVRLTFDHIKGILMDIFIAGTDTSAAIVEWAMSFLMKNPDAMRKAQEEVRNLMDTKGFVNEDDVQQLHFLKAVVKETMRLQPPAPLLVPRESTQKCNIVGYEIPAKTTVYVNAWAIGRDPEAWDKNSHEFNPDRFLGNSIDFKGQDYELIPIGGGRRICPGISIGIATVELSLANLLYKFDWGMPVGMKREDIDTDHGLPGIAVHRRDPLCLVPIAYA